MRSDVKMGPIRFLIFLIILTFALIHSVQSLAESFTYDGHGLTSTSADQELKEHICLSFMIFLEARGDGELSQMFHGMATINRVLNPKRWGDSVCETIIRPSQYESVKSAEQNVIMSVIKGDYNAADDFIITYYNTHDDLNVWYEINQIAYSLITAPRREAEWFDADHFYSPKSLKDRNLPVEDWIYTKELVIVAGTTHFLKGKLDDSN